MLYSQIFKRSIPIILIVAVTIVSLYIQLSTKPEQSSDFESRVVGASKDYVSETNLLFWEFETNEIVKEELIDAIKNNILEIDEYSTFLNDTGFSRFKNLIEASIESTANEALHEFYYTYDGNVSLLQDRLRLGDKPIHIDHQNIDVSIYNRDIRNIYNHVTSNQHLNLKIALDFFSLVPGIGDIYDASTKVYDIRHKYLFVSLNRLTNSIHNEYKNIISFHKKNQLPYEDVVKLSTDMFEGG